MTSGIWHARQTGGQLKEAAADGFHARSRLVLNYVQLQAVIVAETRDGRHDVSRADGEESIRQRWSAYAANGHGGNKELRTLDPSTFRYSLLRVFDPSTPENEINIAESHYKEALDSRVPHGLNWN